MKDTRFTSARWWCDTLMNLCEEMDSSGIQDMPLRFFLDDKNLEFPAKPLMLSMVGIGRNSEDGPPVELELYFQSEEAKQ